MECLAEIYKNHTGKVSDKWTLYLREYDLLFSGFREDPVRILEIGVQNGGSLEIWSKYFRNAPIIVGCDINTNCEKLTYDDTRIRVVIGDVNTDAVEKNILGHSKHFDLIIDDGSHNSGDIAKSFSRYFRHLNNGGLFVAEDLHCSYWEKFEGGLYYPYSSIAFFKRLADVVNHEHWGIAKEKMQLLHGFSEHFCIDFDEDTLASIHSIEFVNSLCIIRKLDVDLNMLGERVIAGQHALVLPLHFSRSDAAQSLDQESNAWTAMSHAPDEVFASLNDVVTVRDEHIRDLSATISDLDERINALNATVTENEIQIASLNDGVTVRDDHIRDLNATISDRDERITELNNTVIEIRDSISWRLTAPVRFIGLCAGKVNTALRCQSSKVMHKAWEALPLSAKGKQRLKSESITVAPFFYNFCRRYKNANLAKTASEENNLDQYSVEEPQYVPRLTSDTPNFEKAARVIAFYLPQFHPVPENDTWWGKGFTEWTNVKPAKPQFTGHYQPHVPDDFLGYYDLRDTSVMSKQIELAKQYGIEGFCFYTYWFTGHRLLETPVDNYLADASLDLPFCICWANENWSRRWDGLDQDLLMEQQYSSEDDVAFIAHMSKYLQDPRYIRVGGKPLLIVYRPNLLPSMKDTAYRWRDWCLNNGLGEIYLAYVQSFEKRDPADYGLDAAIEFPPNNSSPPEIMEKLPSKSPEFSGNIFDWRIFLKRTENYETPTYQLFRGVCPSWDNTARKKNRGTIFAGSSPELFQRWLVSALEETQRRVQEPEQRLIFINAWNEWAEGAHLEPDQRYGYAWLEATRLAQVRTNIIHSKGGFNQQANLAIVIHAYYIDVLEQLLNRLPASIKTNAVLFITTIEEHAVAVKKMAAATGISHEVIVFVNHGRDVLPFLKVLRLIEGRGFSHVLKLHTKKSLHRDDGDHWRNDLYEKLLDPRLVDLISPFFKNNPKVGLIAPAGYVCHLSHYWGSNRANVESLAKRLGFNRVNPEENRFIAGTMFYARLEALRPLLQLALNDVDFETEAGQLDGTLAHAIERVIALSAETVGMGIVSSDQVVSSGESRGAKLEDFYSQDVGIS